MTSYLLTITRRVPNPDYVPARNAYDNPRGEFYSEQSVTTATLDEGQWKKVQAAILEAIR